MDKSFLWLAGGSAAAMLTAVWGYASGMWSRLRSRLIVTVHFESETACRVVEHKMWHGFKMSRFGDIHYRAFIYRVKSLGRMMTIPAEEITGPKLFWKGWLPLWIKYDLEHDKLSLSFFRGTIITDEFFKEACEEWDNRFAVKKDNTRFYVEHMYGTAGKPAILRKDGEGGHKNRRQGNEDFADAYARRLLRWQHDDLGEDNDRGRELAKLALSDEAQEFVSFVKQWCESEAWYKERAIAWKTGCLLTGVPGTGKTSLMRAIAKDLDLPVFCFDLSTFYDDEFAAGWAKASKAAPCIVLLEDIDTVFEGRENKHGKDGLNFDCLLNCLDGIEIANGVLTCITTNKPEKLDPALGVVDSKGRSSRPGRIDRILEMKILDKLGRYKLARRIFVDVPDSVIDAAVAAGEGETGAQFQDRCTREAIKLGWVDPATLEPAV